MFIALIASESSQEHHLIFGELSDFEIVENAKCAGIVKLGSWLCSQAFSAPSISLHLSRPAGSCSGDRRASSSGRRRRFQGGSAISGRDGWSKLSLTETTRVQEELGFGLLPSSPVRHV